jgi:hypothetical protein
MGLNYFNLIGQGDLKKQLPLHNLIATIESSWIKLNTNGSYKGKYFYLQMMLNQHLKSAHQLYYYNETGLQEVQSPARAFTDLELKFRTQFEKDRHLILGLKVHNLFSEQRFACEDPVFMVSQGIRYIPSTEISITCNLN